jgi:hypothetical protein
LGGLGPESTNQRIPVSRTRLARRGEALEYIRRPIPTGRGADKVYIDNNIIIIIITSLKAPIIIRIIL